MRQSQIKKHAWVKHGLVLSGCDGAYTSAPSTSKKAISMSIVRSRMVSLAGAPSTVSNIRRLAIDRRWDVYIGQLCRVLLR